MMKTLVSLTAAAALLGGTMLAAPSAEARPGYRGHGHAYGHAYRGGGHAYRGGGYRRGPGAGAAVAAGIAGLAVGAIASQAYRSQQPAYAPGGYYGAPRPAYGYGYAPY